MKDLALAIINIFRHVGKIFTFVRNLLFNTMLVIVLILGLFALIPQEVSKIPVQSVLSLDISGEIVEEKRVYSSLEKMFDDSVSEETTAPETALQDILDIIETAGTDNRISALLLNLKHLQSGGLDQLQTIGKALLKFRETGKVVVAAEDYYSQTQYYLASYADKIFLNQMGGVDIHGFGVYRLYFREAMEKLAINYNVFKIGSYKSALEPFTRDDMSAEDRKQNEIWLSALWKIYQDDILRQRKLTSETLDNYTSNIHRALQSTQGDIALLALKTGLVDKIATRTEITNYLGTLAQSRNDAPSVVSTAEYLDAVTPSYGNLNWQGDKIGLIIAEGNILPGKQPPGFIGGDSLASLIKNAREDDQIKALVVRVNSGGGSAFASEIIRQELLLLQKKGKPVVISMGAVAASGGYWIAADADEIWASEATITGSIGIFGAIPTFENTLSSLGIRRDGTGTTPLAAGLDLAQPLPDSLKGAIQLAIAHNYEKFLEIVATGREIEKSKVKELAEGRVYDGRTALNIGLVDKLGTLEDAINAAAELADITDFNTEYIRPVPSVKEQLLQFLTTQSGVRITQLLTSQPTSIEKLLKILMSRFQELLILDDPQGIYALWPVKLNF